MGFVDRFRRLEIPEERRRRDWSFLDEPLRLPQPLPLSDQPLLCVLGGTTSRAFVPAPRPPTDASVLFYREVHALDAIDGPDAAEAAWRERHQDELDREGRRFLGTVPTEVVRDPHLTAEARDILRLGLPDPGAGSLAALLGDARLLRLHDKLYDLVTLRAYVAIFERAIAPDCFRALQALPLTIAPEELLAQIEARLPDIHAKARSPLRNKLTCARVVIDGMTLLPIYREPAAGLFEAWARLADRRLKLDLLAAHG